MLLRFESTIFQHWFRYWLVANPETSQYLKQWWLVYWRIYASLGLNELTLIQICISKLGHQWFRYWLLSCTKPLPEPVIVSWTLRNKFQWNLNWGTKMIKNVFQNVIAKYQPQCVDLCCWNVMSMFTICSQVDFFYLLCFLFAAPHIDPCSAGPVYIQMILIVAPVGSNLRIRWVSAKKAKLHC